MSYIEEGILRSRPGLVQTENVSRAGLQALDGDRNVLVYVPPSYRPERPAPFALMLHGADGRARSGMSPFLLWADAAGMILLAPQARASTWDMIRGEYGPDIACIDDALEQTFRRYAVDNSQVAIEGFSDGASYALSVGLLNSGLFTHVIAFSPGFAAPPAQETRPEVFISHGTQDRALPIDVCSRSIVPRLERAGYQVAYREFEGGHLVPESISRDAVEWLLAPPESEFAR